MIRGMHGMGTGELTGLAGKLSVDIVDGKHLYTFEYALPA